MMTDKPTSKNSEHSKKAADKANTITKSTQKSADNSSSKVPQTTVSVDMSNSTKAIKNDVPNTEINKADNKSSADKSSEPQKNVKTDIKKTPSSSKTSSAQQAKKPMKPESKPQLKQESRPAASPKKSKLAIFSLFIALLAVVGVIALYFWHVEQQAAITTQLQQITKATTASNKLAQKDILNTLQAQEKSLAIQFADSANNMKLETQDNIEKLNQMVEKFSQNQPTDWLVHEAEYLVRIAARTLWLEKDSTAAIGLLQDADARITELNDPEILPIRQLIYQDITALKLMPKLETEQAILSLIALGEQVPTLPLITMSIPQEATNMDRFTLSDDVADWRDNISKTWDRFLETFVVVHSRVGELEPILPADQRENLKENLSLKLQIAQWAASKGKNDLFIKSLNDAQAWLNKYFDLSDIKNKVFIESIDSLKNKIISVDTEHKFVSLKAIKKILVDRKPVVLPVAVPTAPSEESSIKEAVETVENIEKVSETNTENVEASSQIIDEVKDQNDSGPVPEVTPKVEPEIINENKVEQLEPVDVKEEATQNLTDKVTEISEGA